MRIKISISKFPGVRRQEDTKITPDYGFSFLSGDTLSPKSYAGFAVLKGYYWVLTHMCCCFMVCGRELAGKSHAQKCFVIVTRH